MIVAVLTVRLYAEWVRSLKEKRMVVKSLLARLRRRFNVSAAETDEQDRHQMLVLSVAAIAGDTAQADSILDHVLNFIDSGTEARVVSAERELR